MASRYMQQFYYSFIRNLTGIHGSVNIAASTAGVSSQSLNGAVAARTGVGIITITMADAWPALVGANFSILSGTAQDLYPQVVSQDVSSAKTVVVKLMQGGTAADPATAITLYVDLKMRNSSVNP